MFNSNHECQIKLHVNLPYEFENSIDKIFVFHKTFLNNTKSSNILMQNNASHAYNEHLNYTRTNSNCP